MTRRARSALTAVDVEALLARKYPAPAFAFMPQLRNGTGSLANVRTADAAALSLWPSRGLHLSGFEIKVRRGDWMAEVANPAKAAEIQRYCDFWWIVATESVVDIAEVPPTWGYMVVDGRTLRTIREAPPQAAEELDRAFVCSVLRNVHGAIDCLKQDFVLASDLDAIVDERLAGEVARRQTMRFEHEYESLKKKVREFEVASGIDIGQPWQLGEIAKAARSLMNADFREPMRKKIDYGLLALKHAVEELQRVADAYDSMEPKSELAAK